MVGPLKVFAPARISVPGPALVKPTEMLPLLVIAAPIVKGAAVLPGLTTMSASDWWPSCPEDVSDPPLMPRLLVPDVGGHEDAAAGERQGCCRQGQVAVRVVLNRRLLIVVAETVASASR